MNMNHMLRKIKYFLRFLPDRTYIQLVFLIKFKRFCNFSDPRTFNEKLNWLKLCDRRPEYVNMVDKYEAKKWVASIIGKEYIIPAYGVWDRFEDIDFQRLPDQFVLKCTHDSEGLVIVKNKAEMNLEKARATINAALKRNFYYIGREWPYSRIKPRILAEKYMEDETYKELRDYKFFCFNGEPKAFFVVSGRDAGCAMSDYYDIDRNRLALTQKNVRPVEPLKMPETFDRMVELSRTLARGIPQVRVDFYEVDGKPYFGEMTLYHMSGFIPFKPAIWDRVFGDWLRLPEKAPGCSP